MAMPFRSARAGGHPFRGASLLLLLAATTSCTVQLQMSEVRDPARPNATIRYSAVRKETRQFPDYSIVDGSIIADESDGAASAGGPKRGR